MEEEEEETGVEEVDLEEEEDLEEETGVEEEDFEGVEVVADSGPLEVMVASVDEGADVALLEDEEGSEEADR